jgi:MFS family permease
MIHKKNIRLLYLSTICQSLIFAYVIERLFWESRGMSIQDVVFTEIIFVVLIVILEIPAGILSDKYSRKTVLIVAGFFQTLEFVFIVNAQSFLFFGIGVASAAIAQALISGTYNSLIYESLLVDKKEGIFARYLGRIEALDGAVVILVLLSGGFIAEAISFEELYWWGAASTGLSTFFLFFLTEPGVKDQEKT